MEDTKPKITEAVRHLMAMPDEVVSAKYIAPILHMNPDVIIRYAKDGTWDADRLGNFIVSGDRVKFFRKDFLQKCGFMDPDPEEPTEHDVILAAISALETILKSQKETILLLEEQNRLIREQIQLKKEGVIERCVRENGLQF